MKRTILKITMIGLCSASAHAARDDYYNAYMGDYFVKFDYSKAVSREMRSNWGFSEKDISKSGLGDDLTMWFGFEFPVIERNHFYSNFALGYRHNGSFNAALFDGNIIYKKHSWKAYVGGYFGFGVDQAGMNGFTKKFDGTVGKQTVNFTNDDTPSVVISGFEIGVSYIVSKHWTAGVKFQLDQRDYSMNVDYDHSQLAGLKAGTILSLVDAEHSQDSVASSNVVANITYSF